MTRVFVTSILCIQKKKNPENNLAPQYSFHKRFKFKCILYEKLRYFETKREVLEFKRFTAVLSNLHSNNETLKILNPRICTGQHSTFYRQ